VALIALQINTNIWFEGVQVCTSGWNAMPAFTSRNPKNILRYVPVKNIGSRLKNITVNLSSSWGVMLRHLAI